MLLNQVEWWLVNSPVRAAVQRHWEAPQLLRLGGPMRGGRALEVGCGCGVGTELILDRFGADHVDALDLDPTMVERARRRLARRGAAVTVSVGDASKIDAPEGHYDAVFDFDILHHVPDWRHALAEIHRVLRPGGRLYAEEIFARFTTHPLVRRLLRHPEEGRFDHDGFRLALEEQGFVVEATRDIAGLGGFFIAVRPARPAAAAASSAARL